MFSTNPPKKKKKKGETASLLHNNWPTQIASPCFEPKFFRVIWDVPQTFSNTSRASADEVEDIGFHP